MDLISYTFFVIINILFFPKVVRVIWFSNEDNANRWPTPFRRSASVLKCMFSSNPL
jgi:hypothetical protein